MDFAKTTNRVLVRNDYAACYDFYTQKLGLVATWGDRNGPYTTFATGENEAPCFAIFLRANMEMFPGFTLAPGSEPTDTICAVIPSNNLDEDYVRLKAAGVEFIGEPTMMTEWGMRCVYFRDPEGNLFELNDASGV